MLVTKELQTRLTRLETQRTRSRGHPRLLPPTLDVMRGAIKVLWDIGALYYPTPEAEAQAARDYAASLRTGRVTGGTGLWNLRAALMRAFGLVNEDFKPKREEETYG